MSNPNTLNLPEVNDQQLKLFRVIGSLATKDIDYIPYTQIHWQHLPNLPEPQEDLWN